jgi:hypothetical protein
MRSMQLDFVRPKRQPWIGWLLLLIGVAAAAWTAVQGLHVVRARAEQAAHAKRLADAAQALALSERKPLPSKPRMEDDKRWQKAAKELGLPWLDVLSALERATKPPVFLTSLKSDSSKTTWLMEAEAPDLDAALSYAQSLQRQPMLRSTQLMSHEQILDRSNRPLVKFSLTAQWVSSP